MELIFEVLSCLVKEGLWYAIRWAAKPQAQDAAALAAEMRFSAVRSEEYR